MKLGGENSVLQYFETLPVSISFTTELNKGQQQELLDIVRGVFKNKELVKCFKSDMSYWTKPFYEAYIRARESIVKAIHKNKLNLTGRYDGVIISKHLGIEFTTFYSIDVEHHLSDSDNYIESKSAYILEFHEKQLSALIIKQPSSSMEFMAPWYTELINFILNI